MRNLRPSKCSSTKLAQRSHSKSGSNAGLTLTYQELNGRTEHVILIPGSQEPYLTELLLPAELTVAISISCPEPHRSLAGATCSASPHQPIITWQRVLTASGGLLATRHPTEPLYLWTLPEEAGLLEGGVSQQALLLRVYSTHMGWGRGGGEMGSACTAPFWACSQLHIWGTGFGCTVLFLSFYLLICWEGQKKKLNPRAWMLVNSNLLMHFWNTWNLPTRILILKQQ